MESTGNTINYLSIEGLPWVLLAWIGLIVFRPFATLVHEIGHLIPAIILTKKEVLIRVGQSGKSWQGKFGSILWEISFLNGREGFTGYDKESLSKLELVIVISGGVISSLMMSIISGWQIFGNHSTTLAEVILVSWFCANSLVFMRSLLPVRLKPTITFPEGPPSDGLELKRIIFGKKR